MHKTHLFILLAFTCSFHLEQKLQAQQLGEYLGEGEEYILYTQTKQVNQFFRRFNGEELPSGKRLYARDSLFRSWELRKEYLPFIVDQEAPFVEESSYLPFESVILDSLDPVFLDFHGDNWFAEVLTTFEYKGQPQKVILFLKLEKAKVGSKWVLVNVYFEYFQEIFSQDKNKEASPAFIHPMSHELDFMNLIKVFRNGGNLEPYAQQGYRPDYLTLFLYEIKKENLVFQSVEGTKFHFFQVPGWYFVVSEVMRSGPYRGWMITQLASLPPGGKEQLLPFIYRE
ncbi:MAG: hypothetical protein AAFQ83_09190 [Bacteroidota bacterium]